MITQDSEGSFHRVLASMIFLALWPTAISWASIQCPTGAHLVKNANFEYCVLTDAAHKDWYHGPFVKYYFDQTPGNSNPIFRNERIEETGNYDMGKKQGVWTRWDRDRRKISETPYQDDRASGVRRSWDKNGVTKEIEYRNGSPVSNPIKSPPPNEETRARVEKLGEYMDSHPLQKDPCEPVRKQVDDWSNRNRGRADFAEFQREFLAQHKKLEDCSKSEEYKRWDAERKKSADAMLKEMERLSKP